MLAKLFIKSLFFTVITVTVIMQSAGADSGPDLERLKSALGGAEPDSVSELPVPGLYEVLIGSQIIYLTDDGRYAVQGEIIDLDSANNLTETRRSKLRVSAIDAVGENRMIIFEPSNGPAKHTATVFTDIDCGYCRKLHREIAAYNDLGIRIRYMMFPRAGLKSESYDKAVTVWCSDDQQQAMTNAKLGEDIGKKTCDNPVASHYQLGQDLGVRGTPSMVLDTGEMVPGYVPADRLMQMFGG